MRILYKFAFFTKCANGSEGEIFSKQFSNMLKASNAEGKACEVRAVREGEGRPGLRRGSSGAMADTWPSDT